MMQRRRAATFLARIGLQGGMKRNSSTASGCSGTVPDGQAMRWAAHILRLRTDARVAAVVVCNLFRPSDVLRPPGRN
jgi:hypothetical protein